MRNIALLDSILALIVLISILIACVVLASCTPPIQAEDAPGTLPATRTPGASSSPRLRIKNSGSTDIKNLTVLFPDSRIHFGDVPAGAITEYLPAPKGVYNYAAYEYELNGQNVSQPVIDWVGESPRPGAAYTYSIALEMGQPGAQRIDLIQVMADSAD